MFDIVSRHKDLKIIGWVFGFNNKFREARFFFNSTVPKCEEKYCLALCSTVKLIKAMRNLSSLCSS